jgi:hypothetical protein
MLGGITAFADDLADLKAASVRYVAAMRGVLALTNDSDCSELISKANDYAAAKVAYYKAARQAMPALLEIAKRQATESRYGNQLIEIFRSFGEDRDEEATGALEAKLNRCPPSDQRDQRALPSRKQSKPPSNSLRTLAGWKVLDGVIGNFNQRSSSSTLQRDDPGSLQNYCLFARFR